MIVPTRKVHVTATAMRVSCLRQRQNNSHTSLTLRVVIATQCLLLVLVLVIGAFALENMRSELDAMKGQLTPVAPQGGGSNANITVEQLQYVFNCTDCDD